MSPLGIALSFVVVALALVVALVPLMAYGWTLFDIIFRIDIGISKLVWLGVVLAIPLAGLLIYWMVRPKRYDPLYEKGDDTYVVTPRTHAVVMTATQTPQLRLVPRESGEQPAQDDERAVSLERAA